MTSRFADSSTSTRVAVGGATVAAGATAAAAKALLDRREGRSRTYRLQHDEEVAAGIRRIAAGRAESAIDHLRRKEDEEFGTAIHEARKDLKKLRSVPRLVRAPLGDALYRRENVRFRDAGTHVVGTARRRGQAGDAGRARKPVGRLVSHPRTGCARQVAGGGAPGADRPRLGRNGGGSVATAVRQIEAGRDAIAEWNLAGVGFDLIADGLGRAYLRGRNRFADARDHPSAENVHEWRKRVKDLWYHLRLVRDANPTKLGKAADRAHELSDILGDHHDLTVLGGDAMGRQGCSTARCWSSSRGSSSTARQS